jgi:hypothetical protein
VAESAHLRSFGRTFRTARETRSREAQQRAQPASLDTPRRGHGQEIPRSPDDADLDDGLKACPRLPTRIKRTCISCRSHSMAGLVSATSSASSVPAPCSTSLYSAHMGGMTSPVKEGEPRDAWGGGG